ECYVARIDETEQQISDIEDKIMENNDAEKKRKTKAKEHNTRIRELSDLLKRSNIQITEAPEDEKREKRGEGLCKQIIAESFPNLGKNTDIKIQEAQKTPNRFNKNQPLT
ncbi:LORF1 protein, partial [Crocuta crocuta]